MLLRSGWALIVALSATWGFQRQTASPRALKTNIDPPVRAIGANYFADLQQSQVWIVLEPPLIEPPSGGPVQLNFTFAFAGTRIDGSPTTIRVRAQMGCWAFPMLIRQPILRFVTPTTIIDLTARPADYRWFRSCYGTDGSSDTVVADLPFQAVRQLAHSETLAVDALGLALKFGVADAMALRSFVDAIEYGVIVHRP
jgi:hypothetical protein